MKVLIESQFLLNYDIHNNITVGGTQRYAYNIAEVCRELGYEVVFITKSSENFERYYDGYGLVVSIRIKNNIFNAINFSRKVYKYAKENNVNLVIYSDIMVSYPYKFENSIAIQHGISWDNPSDYFKKKYFEKFYIKAALRHKRVICVDTNFINWVRCRSKKYFNNPSLLKYICNYGDENVFKPLVSDKNIVEYKLLYPRRLVEHRGYSLFINMCIELINSGYKIIPVFAIERKDRDKLYMKHPVLNSIPHEVHHPNFTEISELYNQAYITYVPTVWSEGTSLSAIESIISGTPVVVTDVGGLGNIVINHFNGYIVPATVESLKEATVKLIENPDIRLEMSINCVNVRKYFGLTRWKDDIKPIISESMESINDKKK